jgi:ubiquinone/menaquinone biosynthesis C-methylase UbiE
VPDSPLPDASSPGFQTAETQNVEAFNQDVADNDGYRYTTNAQLSSRLANRRLTDATLAAATFTDRRVLDIGCGDGTYTLELCDLAHPRSIHGVDLAAEAIKMAQSRVGGRPITFSSGSACALPFPDSSFDVAYLRGVLHHMDNPIDALREALRVANILVVIEPNGYSPILKVLEKTSAYHIAHNEKSYAPMRLDAWVKRLGGQVCHRQWVGLVPMFCPDWMARFLKQIEPIVEWLPGISHIGCAVYVFTAKTSGLSHAPRQTR